MKLRPGDTVITKQGATGEVVRSIGQLRVRWSNGYISRVWDPTLIFLTWRTHEHDE